MSAVGLVNQYGQATRIERPSITVDTGGGQAQTFSLVTATEKVWIQPTSASTARMNGGDYMNATHDGYCRAGAPIRHADELVQNGQRYRVLGYYTAGNLTAGAISHRVIALEFVEGVT